MDRREFLVTSALAGNGRLTAAARLERAVVIDAGKVVGKVRPLHGVNGGPLNVGGTLDLSARFREVAPPLCRLHDAHWPNPDVVDLHVVFPDPTANPDRPESYDFARTDEYVKAVVDAGSGVVYRLGESIEHGKVKRYVHPPKDPARWAAACVGIIRHYTEGWADGLRFPIRYWEVWDEPDNRPAMWSGTDEDYFRLYSVTAKAIKARFPKLLVGGPGLGNTGTLKAGRLEPSPFFGKFLAHCRADAAPLDFLSWHCYSADPHEYPARAREVRRLLDAAGFAQAESHLNEWNHLPGNSWSGALAADGKTRKVWRQAVGGPQGAAVVAATLLLLQDAPLDMANLFTADPQEFGLFDHHGVPAASFYAMKAFRALADAGDRLAVTGDVPAGVAVGAAVNEKRSEVVILASRWAGAGDLALKVGGLPWAGPTVATASLVDDRHELDVVRTDRLGADGRLALPLPAPLVALVRLRPAG